MKKKVLATLLSASMVLSLAACGGSTETATDTTETATNTTETATEAASTETAAETTETAEVTAEEAPEAKYHFTFDEGVDEGIVAATRPAEALTEDEKAADPLLAGATYAITEDDTLPLLYADGVVGNSLYVNGEYGYKLPIDSLGKDEYTISFWINAERLSTYGPTIQLGRNMGAEGSTEPFVTWLNFTQTEWGTASAKIFPVAWNRNSETGAWPWVYATDDSIHGKKEWCMVTVVATGDTYTQEDGFDRVASKFYLDGELMWDCSNVDEAAYGGFATNILNGDGVEGYVGINYWDTVFKGFIDDMYIFDTALTDGQVKGLYELGDTSVTPVAPEGAEAAEEETEAVANDNTGVEVTGTLLGSLACDTAFWTEFSDVVEVPEGESVTVNFKNYTDGLANWDNFLVVLQNVADAHSADDNADYAEYAVLRADNYGWGTGYDNIATAECDWNWDTFTADINGADVELTITNNGDTADVVAVVTTADGKTYNQSYTGIAIDGDLYYCLTLEKAALDIQ
ncbi:MAG: LamG domain-containing protein [Butyrivibrio sp.]|nr:LamG domain-containing protein [Butyrivibrio sp.]